MTATFTLTAPSTGNVNPVIIGSTQTTFTIVANGPTGANAFTGTIGLACSTGTTCTFTPNIITANGRRQHQHAGRKQPQPQPHLQPLCLHGDGDQRFADLLVAA